MADGVLRRAAATWPTRVPALSASAAESDAAWGFARRRPAELAGLWAVLEAADAAVGDALTLVDALPSASRGRRGRRDQRRPGRRHLASVGVVHRPGRRGRGSVRPLAGGRELWQRTREAQESSASLTARFAPEVASVDVEPVRQEVREASTSFFIGRKGRLVRAAAPVLAHLRPGPSTPRCYRRSSRRSPRPPTGRRRRPLLAPPARLQALDPAVNVLSEAGWQAVSDSVSAVERDRDLLAGLPANLSDGVRASRQFGTPLDPSAHRALDRAGRAVSAAVTHTGGSTEDEARFARGRGLLRTWAATATGRTADRPRGAALGRWVDASEALAPLGDALAEGAGRC